MSTRPVRALPLTTLACLLLSGACLTAPAGDAESALRAEVEALAVKAQDWLLDQQQANGSFASGNKFILGVTALAVDALCTGPQAIPGDDPRIAKALALLLSFQQPDGGIYDPSEGLGNYSTALTLMALASAKTGDAAKIKRMQEYLFGSQNVEKGSVAEGGMGYGSKGKGHEDLSNTAMAVEALSRSGVPAADPRMQKALEFIQRCQDLSTHNKLPWVGKTGSNPGGAVYSPEESKAAGSWDPKTAKPGDPAPKLVPYGGMTYQLISSYVALDLKADDPRVAAALAWVKDNYRFDANPGMEPGKERQGLFYYFMAMAKTFQMLGTTKLELKDGKVADWRKDLFEAIKREAQDAATKSGKPGVKWMNSSDRWAEGMPNLNAGYLLKSLKRIAGSL